MKRLSTAVVFMVLFVLGLTSVSYSKDAVAEKYNPELEEIRKAIKDKGAKWEAKENKISRLSKEEQKKLVRLDPPEIPKEQRRLKVEEQGALAGEGETFVTSSLTLTLPGGMDWRNDGGNFVTGVRDQLNCGSCWAFSSTAGLEAKNLIMMNTPGLDLDLSEQVALSCSGAGSCDGGYLLTSFFVNSGLPVESCYPYTASNGSCGNACPDWQQGAYKTTSYTWAVGAGQYVQTADVIKEALFTYGPLVVAFAVYSDFSYYSSGIYSHTGGSLLGYHGVLLVGYDDTNSCFIVKNSWGADWGEDGYFRIAYSQITNDVDFGYWTLGYGEALPGYLTSTITSPADGDGLRGASWTLKGMARPSAGSSIQRVEVSTDGGTSWADASGTPAWSYNWTLPAQEGSYTLMSRVTDMTGLVEAPGAGVTVTVDYTSPSSAITYPSEGADISGVPCTVTGTASDGGSGIREVEVSTDGGTTWGLASGTVSWSYTFTPSVLGAVNIRSRATDVAGNTETPGAGVNVDVVWATSSITSPAPGAVLHGASATVAGTAAGNTGELQQVDVSTDGGATWSPASGTGSWTYGWTLPSVEKDINIKSRVTDLAGNVELPGAGVTVLVDNAGPAQAEQWTRLAGSSGIDNFGGADVDSAGNVYLAGNSNGALEGHVNSGEYDAVVVKYDPAGNLLWSRQFGTSAYDSVARVVADAAGDVYVAGTTYASMDGNEYRGSCDIFIVKFDADGNKLWTRETGSTSHDLSRTAAVDPSGNLYVAGNTFASLDGNTNRGRYDTFLMKYDANGNRLWTRQFGSLQDEDVYGICTDSTGNVYIAGLTRASLDGFTNAGTGSDLYAAKYDPAGNMLWLRQMGSTTSDEAHGVAVNASGDVYVVGYTWGSLDGNTLLGYTDMFIVKFDGSGSKLWTKTKGIPGGTAYVYAKDLKLDQAGNLYIGGLYNYSAAAMKYDPMGFEVWTRTYGSEFIVGIDVDEDGNVYPAGTTSSSLDGMPYAGGQSDIFVRKTSGSAVTVRSDAAFTPSASVGLSFFVGDRSGVTDMQVSNDGVFDSEPWVPYQSSMSWELTSSEGLKTVYVRFTDGLGNVSGGCSDTITLDISAPSSAITAPADGALVTLPYTISGTASDNPGAGLMKVEVSLDGGNTWVLAAGTASWSYSWSQGVSGTYNIRSRATDLLGNTEAPGAGITISVDNNPPTSAITYPAAGAVVTGGTCVITGTAFDLEFGLQKVEVSTDGGTTWADASGTTDWSYTWTLPNVEKDFTIKSRATDNASKVEVPGSGTTVTVDNVGPAAEIIIWASQSQPGTNEVGMAVAAGPQGGAYTAGYTDGGLYGNNQGGTDFFVARYDASGGLLWTRQLGSAANDAARAVATAPDGSLYVAGYAGAGMDGNPGAGGADIFLAKYDASGNKLWSRQLGSAQEELAYGIAIGNDGKVYVTGSVNGAFDGNPGFGYYDALLLKYDSSGNKLWSRQWGSTGYDCGNCVRVDEAGNIYVSGRADGQVDGNAYAGMSDLFLTKFDADGNKLWTRQRGTAYGETAYGLAIDGGDIIYLSGSTGSSLDGNSYQGGMEDLFVMKYDSYGNWQWTKQLGTTSPDTAYGAAVDPYGNVYAAGYTSGGLDGNTSAGGEDVFVVKYDPSGTRIWTRQMGSSANDEAKGIAVGSDGEIFLAGYTNGGLEGNTSSGTQDYFAARLTQGAVALKSGATSTSLTAVDLALSAADASGVLQMRISNDGVFDTEQWQAYAELKSWTLSSGTGTKTVYARFKDGLGYVSDTYSATINLDADEPDSSVTSPPAGATISLPYIVTGTATDGSGTGLSRVEVSFNGGATWNTASGTTSWSYTWTAPSDAVFNILTRSTDLAGNVETPGPGRAVTANTIPASVITSPAGGATLMGMTFTITGTASDPGSGVQKVEVSTDSGTTWSQASGTTSWSYAWTPSSSGSYTILSRATDNAGNTETPGAGTAVTVVKPPFEKSWINQLGTSWYDNFAGFGIDGSGNLYIVGSTSTSFDGNPVFGSEDVFIAKYDAAGNRLWTRQAGSADWDMPYGVAVDAAGNVCITGCTYGMIDGDPNSGSSDIFIMKYDTNGNNLWVRQKGSATWDEGHAVAFGQDGSVYVAGHTDSGLDEYAGQRGLFLMRYDAYGNWDWTRQRYSPGFCDMAVSPSGDIYIVGDTPVSMDGQPLAGEWDYYLVKYSSSGNWAWTVQSGTAAGESAFGLAVDNSGNVYVTGYTEGDLHGVTCSGLSDAFLVKYNGNGSRLWTRLTGTAGYEYAYAASVDPDSGCVYVTGYTDGSLDGCVSSGGTDFFVKKYDSSGGTLWTSQMGTASTDYAYDMEAGTDGSFYLAGTTEGALYGSVNLGSQDAFLMKLLKDMVSPASSVTAPASGSFINGTSYTISGSASDAGGLRKVEVSTNGGSTWLQATGTSTWSYNWTLPSNGTYTIKSRATDIENNVETPGAGVTVTVDKSSPYTYITSPANGSVVQGSACIVTGTATDNSGSGVMKVEVSVDGGATWGLAQGTTSWAFYWGITSSGSVNIRARSTDMAGNVQAAGTSITVTASDNWAPELQHYDWSPYLAGGSCGACHVQPAAFLQEGYRKDSPGFCLTCHNPAAPAHERNIEGRGHSVLVNVTTGGGKVPTYGNRTGGEYNNQPFSRLADGGTVVCATCHNVMRKTEDAGRVWEMTTTTDYLTYTLYRGGWVDAGYLVPTVYRDASLRTGPAYSKSRKAYVVDRSEYTYDEAAGTITFSSPQPASAYIYVTLDYPYLRASSQDNRLCADCHTETTHMGANCLTCHRVHNASNLAGIRDVVRTSDRTERAVRFLGRTGIYSFADGDGMYDGICEVCHTQTKYHRRDGTGFANHSGGINYDGRACTDCHSHSGGFAR